MLVGVLGTVCLQDQIPMGKLFLLVYSLKTISKIWWN